MAKPTRQYVFEGMELLPGALIPFVEKRLESSLAGPWQKQVVERLPGLRLDRQDVIVWDQATLLNTMDRFWMQTFKAVLGRAERAIVNELVDVRNKLSHNDRFSYDDAERALDSMRRLMEAISAGEVAGQLGRMRDTILRTKYAELQRNEERRKTRQHISVETVAGLLPWRRGGRASPGCSHRWVPASRICLPTLGKSTLAAHRLNTVIRRNSSVVPI